jgi:hypothetical protein
LLQSTPILNSSAILRVRERKRGGRERSRT